jgi:HPt (histidine-containing phosphotransfer) domain-containing protein
LENDWDEFRALLRRFVADFKDTADRVRTALAEDRPADAARRLHTLQGTGAALGALNLAAEALELERAVNAGGPRPDALLEAFEAELARVLDALAPWLAELPAAATAAPLDPVQLQTLRQALADRDLAARGLFEALRPALAGACSGPSLAAMTAAMEKLRFQEVLAELDRIP